MKRLNAVKNFTFAILLVVFVIETSHLTLYYPLTLVNS